MPNIGPPAKKTKTGRPIMALLDLLSRRWALRILWELHLHAPCSFRNLQKMCGDISPTVLNSRMKELREAGIVELKEREGYTITGDGLYLGKILIQLNDWAKSWKGYGTPKGAKVTAKKSLPGIKTKK